MVLDCWTLPWDINWNPKHCSSLPWRLQCMESHGFGFWDSLMNLMNLAMVWYAIWRVYGDGLGLGNPNCFQNSLIMMFMVDPQSNKTSLAMFLLTWTCIKAMCKSIATKVIIGLGPTIVIFFLPRVILIATYSFKFGTNLKNWPNMKVCLLSNNCWLISSKTKNVLVVLVGGWLMHEHKA